MATGSSRHENLLVTSATGLAKSRPACALGHKACRDNRSVLYHRVPRLFEALALARGDGRYGRRLKMLGRVQLLILDDWGLSVLSAAERRDLLETLDDRHGRASTIVTSQVPMEHWHGVIGDPTLGDAILDRLVHTLTAFNSPEKACENTALPPTLLTKPQTPESMNRSVEAAAHHRAKYLLTIK